jgi:hypothetical protein
MFTCVIILKRLFAEGEVNIGEYWFTWRTRRIFSPTNKNGHMIYTKKLYPFWNPKIAESPNLNPYPLNYETKPSDNPHAILLIRDF